MRPRTWAEYLDEAGDHLEASRAAVAAGRAIPPSPVRPIDPIPDELVHQARILGIGYDTLATEVMARMSELQGHRPSPFGHNRPGARFVDHYA